MARRAKHPTDKYAKLTYFASILILKNHSPEMSYFEAEVMENDEDPVSVYIPFFYGAVKALEEMDSQAWESCCKDTILPDELEQVIEPFCNYFGITQPAFAHFFVPGAQIDYTNFALNRSSTFQDIGALIFEYVLLQKFMENGKGSVDDYLRMN